MIRSSVTVSLVPEAQGGPFIFWDDLPAACQKAKALGFDAVEVFPPSADAVDPGELRGLLDKHGLALAAVGTGGGWVKHRLTFSSDDGLIRKKAKEFARSIIDFAAQFQAPAIIGSMQGRAGDGIDRVTARDYLREALEELGEHAARFGVPLLYEPLNRYETHQCITIEGGMHLLHSLSTKNVLLLADLFHMNIEEPNLPDAIRAGAGYIGHVHFVDSNRRPAGLGHTDFAPIAAALREIKYDRFVSAEAFPYPDPDAAAKQTIAAFRRYFASCG